LGYNVLVVSKKGDAAKARDGGLFGSVSATLKSMHGKLDQASLKLDAPMRISEAGYNQIGQFESSIWDSWQKRKKRPISSLLRKQFMASGIFEEPKDHTVIVVPAPVATGIKTTVGLGDVVSACAVAFQVA
ncbi:MAG: ADP-dependent glucokinase/phosphofructokinase, partial [Candidatus Micrarchaeota archaeon]|nr:ADP-dependent glucokinase/phosphofructokinase [Candidatus Micrarchaeota archaeon]